MCSYATCRSCGKPTYSGCGAHIEQVLGHVPREARCRCREMKAADRQGATGTPSWLRSLFGK